MRKAGMNFDLTDEQKMIRDMARDFAREVIAPRAEETRFSCVRF